MWKILTNYAVSSQNYWFVNNYVNAYLIDAIKVVLRLLDLIQRYYRVVNYNCSTSIHMTNNQQNFSKVYFQE